MAAKKKTTPKVKSKKNNHPVALYDAVSGSGQATGAGNKRRKSQIETKGETGRGGILTPYNRLNALNLCRDAVRNYSSAKSIEQQLKVNVIGPSPKAQINTDENIDGGFGKEATSWINSIWMKNCDFIRERRFAKLAQIVEATKKREGDLLAVFDDEMIKDSGKLLFFEADLMCDVSDKLEEFNLKKWTMIDGIVKNEFGQEIGYATTHRRGQTSVSSADATIWPRDPDDKDKNMVKLIREDYRLIQGRGVSPMLASIADFLDCYEMRSKELQSAKVAASFYASVKRKEAITDYDDERFDPDAQNPTDQDPGYEGEDLTLPEAQTESANYERLEKLTGGQIDYLDSEDEISFPDINRPNVAMKEFLDYVMDSAGSSFGFAHAYTRLKADTSYTAFRGDMILTWVSIYAEQKDIEDEFLDWAVIRAVRWGIRKGAIKAKPVEGWEQKLSWNLPTLPFVDELKERKAQEVALKNGVLTYSDILGPDWDNDFTQQEKEQKSARAKKLPLALFETKSGGSAEAADNPGNQGDTDNE
jgi:capsid protein